MEKTVNKVFSILNLSSLIFLIIGIILALFPTISLSIISYSLAVILLIIGISFMTEQYKSIFWSSFSTGLICLILGIVILITPNFITNIITTVLGILFIISGISKANLSISLKDRNNNNWIIELIIAILNITCGIILFIKPIYSAITITSLIGIILIVYSISDIIDICVVRKNINSIFKMLK